MLTNIPNVSICQFQTSLAPVNLVHFSVFSVTYNIYSPCNIICVLDLLTILSHTHSRITIQYNQSNFLWNYIWTLVKKFMN